MIKKTILCILLGCIFLIAACQTNQKTALKRTIYQLDDSLKQSIKNEMQATNFKLNKALYQRAINANIKYYNTYPKDSYTDTALHKIAALYRGIGEVENAVQWRDTLLSQFPQTYHKIGLLELQMSYYDFNHYNPDKIKFYIQQLLAIKTLPDTKRKQYEFRLKHIDLSFEELMQLQINNAQDSLKKK